MRSIARILILGVLLLQSSPALAILGLGDIVLDPSNLAQNTTTALNAIETAYNTAQTVANTAQSVINEFNIVRNQIHQYETMVKNLARMPEGLNVFQIVNSYSARLTGLLSQANAISYELSTAPADFERLYGPALTAAKEGNILALRQQWLAARTQASGMVVQLTAVKTNLTEVHAKLCALIDGVFQATGNLDVQQLGNNMRALQIHSQQDMHALAATQARLHAQKEAEEAGLEQMRLQMIQEITAPLPETGTYVPQGKLPVYRYMK